MQRAGRRREQCHSPRRMETPLGGRGRLGSGGLRHGCGGGGRLGGECLQPVRVWGFPNPKGNPPIPCRFAPETPAGIAGETARRCRSCKPQRWIDCRGLLDCWRRKYDAENGWIEMEKRASAGPEAESFKPHRQASGLMLHPPVRPLSPSRSPLFRPPIQWASAPAPFLGQSRPGSSTD